MLPRRSFSLAVGVVLLAVCGLLLDLGLVGLAIGLALAAFGAGCVTRLSPPAELVRRFPGWWRRRRWLHLAMTVWTLAVVALVVVGVVAAEREPGGGGGFAPSNDQVAGIVVAWGLMILLAGCGVIALVAWRIDRLRGRRSVEGDDRRRRFTSSL